MLIVVVAMLTIALFIPFRPSADTIEAGRLASNIVVARTLSNESPSSGMVAISKSRDTFWDHYLKTTPSCGPDGSEHYWVDWVVTSLGRHFLISCGSLLLIDSSKPTGKP